MSDFWKQWEGQVINGRYPLRRLLGVSSHSAVFLTEDEAAHAAAAIKFIRADAPLADLQLARWRAVAAISHPHLIRLLGWGQCSLGRHELLFVVMEYAEQSLAQILIHRALTFDEVRELMGPTLAALAFIHRSDWVYGQMKPSNICVVNDTLKLASDVLRPAGDSAVGTVEFSPYHAPEETAGTSSSVGDLWGLGMTVVAALTRYPVARRHERSEIALPASVTPAFAAAIRQCLSLDPARRPSATDLEAQLKSADLKTADPKPVNPKPVNPSPSVPDLQPAVKAEVPRVAAKPSRNMNSKSLHSRRHRPIGGRGVVGSAPHARPSPSRATGSGAGERACNRTAASASRRSSGKSAGGDCGSSAGAGAA